MGINKENCMLNNAFDQNRLEIRYRLNAPRERVFRAWTEPELLKKWFRVSPETIPVLAEVDFRVGGRYRLGLQTPGSQQANFVTGVYQLIQRPEKLVFTWSWEGDSAPETLVTIEFLEAGDKTELVLVHSNFINAQQVDLHDRGWIGCLPSLAAALEQ
jgi:uncharacterized protein YndB with AHSA1/START domain